MFTRFNIGDLVSFDAIRSVGVIIDIKEIDFLDVDDYEYLVLWENGEQFWCLDVTLAPIKPSFLPP
jgi:hypothetical protein